MNPYSFLKNQTLCRSNLTVQNHICLRKKYTNVVSLSFYYCLFQIVSPFCMQMMPAFMQKPAIEECLTFYKCSKV